MRTVAGLLAALALAVALGWGWTQAWLASPVALEAPLDYHIPPGRSLSAVARDLHRQGVIRHPRLWSLDARLRGAAGAVKAGEYRIEPGQTHRGLLEQFVAGRVLLHAFTAVEGWTYGQLLAALRAEDTVRVVTADMSADDIAGALGLGHRSPEGWFLPETYLFPRDTADLEILRRGQAAMAQVLEAAWVARDPGLALETPYEALVLASIVEKETALESERARIAGVFLRRLERGMRLQTDPTVIYGLGADFDGNLTRRDLARDTPYNTYTRGGLPPTPIALPGRASIEAVMHPEAGEALYFVATGEPDGSHYFSATLEEHNEAVARYLRRLRRGGGQTQ